jgi:hypothetical protein
MYFPTTKIMKDQKTWLKDVADEVEYMSKNYYDSCIKDFEKKGIEIKRIRKTVCEKYENLEDSIIEENLKQYYEEWQRNNKSKEDCQKALESWQLAEEPGGASWTTKLAVVLYELKEKDPKKFNRFCERFL